MITFLPSLAAGCRRLHDVNKSGWWQLISITVIGIIPLIIWLASKPVKEKISINYFFCLLKLPLPFFGLIILFLYFDVIKSTAIGFLFFWFFFHKLFDLYSLIHLLKTFIASFIFLVLLGWFLALPNIVEITLI